MLDALPILDAEEDPQKALKHPDKCRRITPDDGLDTESIRIRNGQQNAIMQRLEGL
jgi:hypothetical protein